MKMSNVFELPLNCGLVDNVDVGYAIELEPEKSVTDEQACAVDYAINNHDRLAEESARLREALSTMVIHYDRYNANLENISKLNDSASSAKQLLNQLREQNNDK